MERKWTSEDACVNLKYIFFVFWNTWTAFKLKCQWIRTINTGFWHLFFLIRLTEQSVNHHLREFNIPKKNTNALDSAWHIAGNHRIRGQKKIAFSYSDSGGTLEDKLNDLKPLFSRKKSLTFQKRLKKMLLHWIANLADQNIKHPRRPRGR